MRTLLACMVACLGFAGPTLSEPVRWQRFPPLVSEALDALRESDHRLGDTITMNLDGPRTGRAVNGERPLNFDASRDLSWTTVDLNGDGRAEVILLIEYDSGNGIPWGVVMHQAAGRWRVVCEFQHEAWLPSDRGLRQRPIMLLDRRTLGWRHFRVADGTYGWTQVDGKAWCDRIVPRSTRLIEEPLPIR